MHPICHDLVSLMRYTSFTPPALSSSNSLSPSTTPSNPPGITFTLFPLNFPWSIHSATSLYHF